MLWFSFTITLLAAGSAHYAIAGANWKTERTRMAVNWEDLDDNEQTALKRMNRGPYPALSEVLAERLISLGLAERRPSGVGINRVGRQLVIDTLLAAREK